jgi:hypothetical protein
MKILKVLLINLVGASAFAGSVNFDARMDLVNYTANDARNKPSYSAFQASRAKLDFQGSLGEMTKYRTRFNLLQNFSGTSTSNNGKISNWLDFAFIGRKVGDNLSFNIGKIISGMGGQEGILNSGDIYLRTIAGDELANIYWPMGAQLEWADSQNKVLLSFANITSDVTTTPPTTSGGVGGTNGPSQTRMLYGATWFGKFMDNAFQPTVSYHMENFNTNDSGATTPQNLKNSYLAAGLKYVFSDMWELEADYLNNKYDQDPQLASTVNPSANIGTAFGVTTGVLNTNSIYALVRYNMAGNGSIHLKREQTTRKVATNTTTANTTDRTDKYAGTTVAYEFKPMKDENWRAHVAFTQRDFTPDTTTANDTQTEKIVFVGMRVLADFLK